MITITNTFSESKVIEYLGATLIVPWWADYICTDSDGKVYVFRKEPYWDDNLWLNSDPDYPVDHVANGILSINPKNSMVKL